MRCFRCPPPGSIIYNAKENIPESHISMQAGSGQLIFWDHGCINWQWKLNVQLCFLPVVLPWCLWNNASKGTFWLDWPINLINLCSESCAFVVFRIFILLYVPRMFGSGFSGRCAPSSLAAFGTLHSWKASPDQKGAEPCVKPLLHFSELSLPWRHSCLLLRNVFLIFCLMTNLKSRGSAMTPNF